MECALIAVTIAACGGGGKHPASASTASTPSTPGTSTTAPAAASRHGSAVLTGPLHARLTGENHAPKMNRPWRYSVTVTDAGAHPLSGTVDIEFVFGGQVVGRDTPLTHPVRAGSWRDSLKFTSSAVGQPLSLRAVVHTSLGTVTLDWPITVTA